MQYKKVISVILVFLLLLLTACGSVQKDLASTEEQAVAPVMTPTPAATLQPTPHPTTVPTTTPEPTPSVRSYTTGLPVTQLPEYKLVGVIIENSTDARPQYGLQAADIVYEAPVEGCTRFFCIYNDTLPEKVGPVRSARLYFIKFQQEWDSSFVHFGGPQSGKSNVYRSSSSHIKTRLNLITGKYNDYWWRGTEKAAPSNVYFDVHKSQELIEEESAIRTFKYNESAMYPGERVLEIVLPFYSGQVTYRYDERKDVFLRYMDDKEFKDAETDKAIEIQNIIVQYNRYYHGGEKLGRWLCDLTGSGKAEFFIGGRHIIGTWERENYETPTIYKDADGNEIVLRPGNTWIASHPEEKDITVVYEQ